MMDLKRNIGILVPHGKYFAAEHLAKALSATLYNLHDNEIIVEHLIIIGMRALEKYSKLRNKNFKSVAVIFSDTNLCKYSKWCNDYVRENNIAVYAMPDLHNYLSVPYIPAYQTIALPKIKIKKPTDRIVICHSPGLKGAYNFKGTKQIRKIVNGLSQRYNIEYVELIKETWEDCIKEKSKAHIFIDQLTKGNPYIPQKRFGGKIIYDGALGKSGIEGMFLKCCVITTMNKAPTEEYFPFPPVVISDYYNFENDLEKLIADVEHRNQLIDIQYDWVKKYCSPDFVGMNVTRHIQSENKEVLNETV